MLQQEPHRIEIGRPRREEERRRLDEVRAPVETAGDLLGRGLFLLGCLGLLVGVAGLVGVVDVAGFAGPVCLVGRVGLIALVDLVGTRDDVVGWRDDQPRVDLGAAGYQPLHEREALRTGRRAP